MAEDSGEALRQGIRYLRRIAESEGPFLFTSPARSPGTEAVPPAAGSRPEAGGDGGEEEEAPATAESHLSGMAIQESLGGAMGPQPWAGAPPRPGVDPVGLPASMTDPVPESVEERANLLVRLNRESCTCLKCELGEIRNSFVFGVGNPDATLMLIGEAPGAEEDRQGEPFVGKAGQLLNRILEAIDFKREDVYIANILKCRPPNNRDPQVSEVDACEPYLRRQIDLIQPAVICALGRIAGQTLLKTSESLTRLRGKVHHYQGRPLVVTYHPAALLRNPNWKKPTWEDVQMLRRIHDERLGR